MPIWLVTLFAQYGYAAIFVGVMLENAGLPVPGETVLLAGAVIAHQGELSFWLVVGCALAGAVIGDNVGFAIGRRGGRALLVRVGPRIGLTAPRLAAFDRFFHRHGPKTVFIARFVTGLRVFGAVLAGASGLSWRVFLFYNAVGALAWSVSIGAAGYFLGHSWETLERWIGRGGAVALALGVVAVAVVILRRRREEH